MNVKISSPEVLNWHAVGMDRRVSDLKESTFKLKSLSQHQGVQRPGKPGNVREF